MSTTFAVLVNQNEIIVARRVGRKKGRSNVTIIWTNPLAQTLPNDTEVFPTDNTAQGVNTIGDLKEISNLNEMPDEPDFSMYTQLGNWAVAKVLERIVENEELKKYKNSHFMKVVESHLDNIGKTAEEWTDTEARNQIYEYLEKHTDREDLEF